MKRYNIHGTLLVAGMFLVLGVIWTSNAWSQAQVPYSTGFESPDFSVGALPQDGWTASAGSPAVQNAVFFEGSQALQIPGGAATEKLFTSTAGSVIWLDGRTRMTSNSGPPDPTLLRTGSTFVYFDSIQGILCLNGDGNGGGSWSATGVNSASGTWVRVSLRIDFTAKTYDAYVDGLLKLSNLGFRNNTIDKLNGFSVDHHQSTGGSYLDAFSASTSPPDFIPTSTPTSTSTPTQTSSPVPTSTPTNTPTPTPNLPMVQMTFNVAVAGTGGCSNTAAIVYVKPDNSSGLASPGIGCPVIVGVKPGSTYTYSTTLAGSDSICHRWISNQKLDGTAPLSGLGSVTKTYYEQWKPNINLPGADATHLVSTESRRFFGQPLLQSNVQMMWNQWCDAGSRLTFSRSTTGNPVRTTSSARSWIITSCSSYTITYLGPSVPITFAAFIKSGTATLVNTAAVKYFDPSGIQRYAYPAPGQSVSVAAASGTVYIYPGSLAGSDTTCHRWWCNQKWDGVLPPAGSPATLSRNYFEQFKPTVLPGNTDAAHAVRPLMHIKFAQRVEGSEPYIYGSWSDWTDSRSLLAFPPYTTGLPPRYTSDTRKWTILDCATFTLTFN